MNTVVPNTPGNNTAEFNLTRLKRNKGRFITHFRSRSTRKDIENLLGITVSENMISLKTQRTDLLNLALRSTLVTGHYYYVNEAKMGGRRLEALVVPF